jgi:hypothetical protein
MSLEDIPRSLEDQISRNVITLSTSFGESIVINPYDICSMGAINDGKILIIFTHMRSSIHLHISNEEELHTIIEKVKTRLNIYYTLATENNKYIALMVHPHTLSCEDGYHIYWQTCVNFATMRNAQLCAISTAGDGKQIVVKIKEWMRREFLE